MGDRILVVEKLRIDLHDPLGETQRALIIALRNGDPRLPPPRPRIERIEPARGRHLLARRDIIAFRTGQVPAVDPMSHSRVGVERDCPFELAFGKRKIPIVSQGNSAKHQVRIGQLIIQGDGFDGRFPGWQQDLARCAIRIAHVNIAWESADQASA